MLAYLYGLCVPEIAESTLECAVHLHALFITTDRREKGSWDWETLKRILKKCIDTYTCSSVRFRQKPSQTSTYFGSSKIVLIRWFYVRDRKSPPRRIWIHHSRIHGLAEGRGMDDKPKEEVEAKDEKE